MAVFRPLLLEPGPVKTHEIAKSSGVGIEGMLHEGGEAGRQLVRKALLARLVERAGQ